MGEIEQRPTTCFSQSPIIAPMWAHYAQNHTGFVLEFNVEALRDNFEDISLGAVEYRETAHESLSEHIGRAYHIRKPRHLFWATNAIYSAAYFTKFLDWSYEKEVRLVSNDAQVEKIEGFDILYVPMECVTACIVGSSFPKEELSHVQEFAESHDLACYQLKLGKSRPDPFMIDDRNHPFIFVDGELKDAPNACASCSEPIDLTADKCPWCSITKEDSFNAAMNNTFRYLDHAGILGSYLEQAHAIRSKHSTD